MLSRSVRNIRSLALSFLVCGIVSLSILVVPGTGRTEPPSYEAELAEGKRLVKEFKKLTANPNTPRQELVKMTIEIFQSQQAKMILKGSERPLGKIYNDIMYVGDDSIVAKLLNSTKDKLRAVLPEVPPDVLERLVSIRNKASIASGSAPMDLDIGLITGGDKKLERELLKKLGGVKGVKLFEEALQKALIESFVEIAAGTPVDIHKLKITGTTPWHRDAYREAGVLRGDPPSRSQAAQAGDVTKVKVDEEQAEAEDNPKTKKIGSQESAWREQARGTLKDRAKIESVFNEVYTQTGKKAGWTSEQKKIWEYLEMLVREGISGEEIRRINAEIKKLTGGKDISGACRVLADAMEAAWKLAPRLKLTPGQFIEVLITNKDGLQRRVLIDEQIKMRGEGEAGLKAFQTLKEIINGARGNEFITKMLASHTAKNLMTHAVVFAPMALMNMFVKWEMGQMNDVHELAVALVQVVPFENGFELMYVGDKSLADTEVLKAFLYEGALWGAFWGATAICPKCAPLLIGGVVGYMAYTFVKFKVDAVRLQNHRSELVDLLVYNGEFPDGKFEKLVLLNKQVIERWDMRRFLFETKSVTVRKAVPNWGLRIPLSEKTEEVYKKYYLANDPAMTQFKDASAQLEQNAGCNKNSTEKFCRVYDLIQRQMEMRRQEVIDAVMIPHLIRLAEEKYATLNAPEELKDDLNKLQAEIEMLRGSSLEVTLSEEVSKRADEEAEKKDTGEEKKLARGEYWQKAVEAYRKIVDANKKLQSEIPKLTGFERASILQIRWTGNYEHDQLRSAQSIDGFYSDTGKVIGDITEIKGAGPTLNDTVDKQALELLGDVVFPWRASLDSSNKADTPSAVFGAKRFPVPGKNSSFYKEYEDALESVRKLYGRKKDFQAQLENGARIIKDQDFLLLGDGKGSGLELKFTDEQLEKNWKDAALSIQWAANPEGTFRPDDKNLKITFTAARPEPVTISVQVTKRGKGGETVTGTLKVVLPVKVPDNFLELTLNPAAPKPGGKVKADATIDRRYDSTRYKYHYQWSDTNCQVEKVDWHSTTVTAPESGVAAVSVELLIEDADETWVSLITKQTSFNVGGKTEDKKDDKSAGKPDDKTKDDHQDKPGAPSVAVQPEPSAKGQEGVGSGAEGQAGVGSWAPGGSEITGQPDTGGADAGQAETGTKEETGVTGGTEAGTTAKPKTGMEGEAGVTDGQSGQTSVSSQPTGAGEGDKPGKEPTGADLKSRAEGRYKWIKDVLDYYEKLIELEKKAFQTFEKQVREFVMKKAAVGGYPVRDKDTDKKIERLEEELKNVGVYVVKERTTDPLTGESFLGNVIKGRPPTPAEKAKAEELAELKDPMTHEEFQCLDGGLKVRRDRLPEIKQKAKVVRESKLYNNFAEYSAWNQYKEYLSEIASLKGRLNLPDPIPSPVTLPWSYSSSCGGAVVLPTKAKLGVVLNKAPNKASYKPGDIVNISAVVTGGKAPYTYTWSGNHAGKGQQVSFTSSKPGNYTLSVEVKDSTGAGGGASMPLVVNGITASIEGLGGQVIYGTSRLISVSSQDIAAATAKQPTDTGRKKGQPKQETVREGQIMPSPDEEDEYVGPTVPMQRPREYKFIWFSDKEGLSFSPSTSDNPATEVLFNRMGPIKIWADIQKRTGEGVYSTIGETRQEVVTIIPPKFKWEFKPPKGSGKIGLEVKATITTEPEVDADLINYEWSYPESSNRMEYEKNTSVIGFVPKNPNPMMLLVAPKVPHYREPIGGGLKEEYQAGAYTVTVTGPKAAGPKPQIWKCETQLGGACPGIVEVDKEIAVHQRVEFSAEVSPKPESDVRYSWTVSGGSCTLSNPIVRDVGVTCSETGSYVMTVIVRDKDNIELGKGTGMLSVTISQEEMNKAATKVKPKITLKADKTTLTIGESVSATATVEGGKAPYSYTWSGEYQGQGQSVRFSPKKPGDHTLSVEVTDAKGSKDSANIAFKVDAFKVTIEGLRDEVVYGTKLNLSAKPDNYQIVWKSEPAIAFTPQQGLGGKTVASFIGVGRVKVWAVAQQNAGAVIGESEKKEINVTTPKFEITFDPPKGKVGDEITATIKTTPPIDKSLLKFVWESPKRSDIRPYDANIVRFTPKSTVPVEFLIIAKEPVKSQALAEIKGTYTAEAVKLVVALHADKTRLKVGETATIRADVKGGKVPYYTFTWKGEYAGQGSSIRFTARKSGPHTLSVDVTDGMGNKGLADISIDVEEPTFATSAAKEPDTSSPPREVKSGGGAPSASTAKAPIQSSPSHQARRLSRLWIVPGRVALTVGESSSFKAYGVYSDGDPEQSVNVTGRVAWSPGQVFKAEEPGGYTVTATFEGVSDSATITVKAKPDIAGATAATEEFRSNAPGSKPQPIGSDAPSQPQGRYIEPPLSEQPPAPPPPGATGAPYPPPCPPPGYPAPAYLPPGCPPSAVHPGGPSDFGSGYGHGPTWGKAGKSTSPRDKEKKPKDGHGSGSSQGGGSRGVTQGTGGTISRPEPPSSSGFVMIEITNRSRDKAHIFSEGETFGPSNRFESGEKRRVNVRVPSNNKITFHAGRNGQVIASKAWHYDPAHPDRIPVVIFDESNPFDKLSITTGLR